VRILNDKGIVSISRLDISGFYGGQTRCRWR
jgi:hypothetical protein